MMQPHHPNDSAQLGPQRRARRGSSRRWDECSWSPHEDLGWRNSEERAGSGCGGIKAASCWHHCLGCDPPLISGSHPSATPTHRRISLGDKQVLSGHINLGVSRGTNCWRSPASSYGRYRSVMLSTPLKLQGECRAEAWDRNTPRKGRKGAG